MPDRQRGQKIRGGISFLLATGFALSLWAGGPSREPDFANDIGPSEIDVSDYPARMQAIYREKFLPLCSVCHGAARAVNAEFLEMDESSLSGLRRDHPGLLSDPQVLRADKDVWKRYIKRMKMRPPCCGACPVMTQEDSKDVWEFLVYDSIQRKTGPRAGEWQKRRRELLEEFARRYPQKYKHRYQ